MSTVNHSLHDAMGPVLIAHDGHGLSALRAGQAIGAALDLPLVVAVACPGLHAVGAAERALRRAAEALGAEAARVSLPAEDVAAALIELAVELDASLIAVGPDIHGRTAHQVARRAHCPVLVAPEDAFLVEAPLRVGVAFDHSVASHYARSAAEHIAAAAGGSVRLITVTEGRPAQELREASEDLDLLACGSHGRGLRELLVGSVSSALIDDPVCPVLVVPPRVRAHGDSALGLTTAAMNR